MKMYKFTLNNEKLKIRMDVYDVEETPKTYKIVNGYGNVYESAIRKDELDTVDRFYGARMFSLSPDKSAYIKKLIDRTEEKLVIPQLLIYLLVSKPLKPEQKRQRGRGMSTKWRYRIGTRRIKHGKNGSKASGRFFDVGRVAKQREESQHSVVKGTCARLD